MLSKQAIYKAIEQKLLTIAPFDRESVEAAHVNLHLAAAATIKPKGFVIGATREKITLSNKLCGQVEGKAGLAKQGISIEQSSHFLEPSTDNVLTLEMFNASDEAVTLEAGQEIAKLFILKIEDEI
jgi:deoxycytidine triphosphate deaminase